MLRFRSLGFLVTVGLAALVQADDTWMPSMGGAPDPMAQHPAVRMVREDLVIRIPEGEVDVRYLFVNEGPATQIKMSFPGDDFKNKYVRMLDFRTWVDGKEVKATWQPLGKTEFPHAYKGYWVRTVTFAKGEKKWVRNRYRTQLGNVSDGSNILAYVLGTGRTWKGPIGDLRIQIDVSGLAEQRGDDPMVSLGDGKTKFQKTGNLFIARLKDYEPKPSDWLLVNWHFGFIKIDWNGVAIDDARSPSRQVNRLRNAYDWPLWRDGRLFAELRSLAVLVGGSIDGLPNGAYRLKAANRYLDFRVGGNTAADDETGVLDLGAKSFVVGRGRMMVPLRPVIEHFGGKIGWDAQTGRLTITNDVELTPYP